MVRGAWDANGYLLWMEKCMSPGETCVVCGSPDIQLASYSMETQLWQHWCAKHLPDMTPLEAQQIRGRFISDLVSDMWDVDDAGDTQEEGGES